MTKNKTVIPSEAMKLSSMGANGDQ